jgi:hypothetical protein
MGEEGREKLTRRAEITGLHRLVWWLGYRDLLRLYGELTTRDSGPMFPWSPPKEERACRAGKRAPWAPFPVAGYPRYTLHIRSK